MTYRKASATAATALILLMTPAAAQTTAAPDQPVETVPTRPECTADNPNRPADCDNLSRELDETGGVITPPATADGDIRVPAPDPDPGNMPVIRPGDLPDDPATDVDEGAAVPK